MSFPSFDNFLRQFREVFQHSADGKEVREQFQTLCQGSNTVANYALTFRTVAALTGCRKEPLKLLF